MNENDIKDLLTRMRSAYEIFLQEFDSHLKFLSTLAHDLRNADNPMSILSEKRVSAQNRFHVIKGGAGFLKLTDIAACASEAEETLKKTALDADSLDSLSDCLQRTVSTLEQEVEELRKLLQN